MIMPSALQPMGGERSPALKGKKGRSHRREREEEEWGGE